MTSFRNFDKFVRAGATDGANKIGGELFGLQSEDTVVTSEGFHCDSSLITGLTVAAQTGHGQVAAFDLTSGQILGFEAETGRHFDLRQIQNRIAASAEEVDVGCGVGIESLGAVDGADADDQTLLLEQGQIPVDRCLRDIRVGLLQHLVNHLSGRVRVCVHQTV